MWWHFFLPSNTTSLIQSMDQGVIKSFKKHRSEFLKKILNIDLSLKFCDNKKHFTIKDCLYLVAESWDLVTQNTSINAWHNVWPESLFVESEGDESVSMDSVLIKRKKRSKTAFIC